MQEWKENALWSRSTWIYLLVHLFNHSSSPQMCHYMQGNEPGPLDASIYLLPPLVVTTSQMSPDIAKGPWGLKTTELEELVTWSSGGHGCPAWVLSGCSPTPAVLFTPAVWLSFLAYWRPQPPSSYTLHLGELPRHELSPGDVDIMMNLDLEVRRPRFAALGPRPVACLASYCQLP